MKNILPFSGKAKKQAFDTLLLSHMDQLYRLAYRFCGNRDDAEDLVQDVLIKLYPRGEELLKIEQLGPWLARTLYNHFVDNVRRYQRNPVQLVDSNDASSLDRGGLEDSPDHVFAREQQLERLQILVNQLNPEQRSLLALHDMEGYTLPELVKMLDTPLGTLKSRLFRARNRLKELVKLDGTF